MKFFSIVFFLSQFTYAEYRVFVLKIENTTTQKIQIIKSTLDPDQYKSIYLLHPNESISYVDTWRCTGTTRDFTPLCQRAPAAHKQTEQSSPQNVQNKS